MQTKDSQEEGLYVFPHLGQVGETIAKKILTPHPHGSVIKCDQENDKWWSTYWSLRVGCECMSIPKLEIDLFEVQNVQLHKLVVQDFWNIH